MTSCLGPLIYEAQNIKFDLDQDFCSNFQPFIDPNYHAKTH